MIKIHETPLPIGVPKKEIPDTNGKYMLTTDGRLYRVQTYVLHTLLEGWTKRTRFKEVKPRKCGIRTLRYCLSYGGKRRDVAISVLVRQVFGG